MIIIKGKEFSSIPNQSSWMGERPGIGSVSEASVEIDDMQNPVYKRSFITPDGAAAFVSRLSLAIKKEGGSSFS
jgi:hypothetical protein